MSRLLSVQIGFVVRISVKSTVLTGVCRVVEAQVSATALVAVVAAVLTKACSNVRTVSGSPHSCDAPASVLPGRVSCTQARIGRLFTPFKAPDGQLPLLRLPIPSCRPSLNSAETWGSSPLVPSFPWRMTHRGAVPLASYNPPFPLTHRVECR